jgi:hypothetical protein
MYVPEDCFTIFITLRLLDKKSETADEKNPIIELLNKNPKVLFLEIKYWSNMLCVINLCKYNCI